MPRRYALALRSHLAPQPGTRLQTAGTLGREAVANGLDSLDLAKIHAQALLTLRPAALPSGNGERRIGRAAAFFAKALAPMGSSHRAAVTNNGRLNRRNVMMGRQVVALAAARRQLKREVGSREALQEALEASERHYGQLLEKSGLMQEHLRSLSRDILSAHEEERRRISRELHDEIGQTLTAINVKLSALKREATVNTAGLKTKIASTQRLLERSMSTVHRFARDLRPPLLDDLGLLPALRSLMKAFTKRAHIPVRFAAFAAVERLSADKRTILYRVAQEALTNVVKHAHATAVDVSIVKLREVARLEIHDDGRSFRVERILSSRRLRRLGLVGMRERVEMVGGIFAVESAPGRGTTVRADIPLGDGREGSRRTRAGRVR